MTPCTTASCLNTFLKTSLILSVFGLSTESFSATSIAATMDPAKPTSTELTPPQEAVSPISEEETSPKRKRVLDQVRRGVVIIETKTYATTDAEKRTAWSGSGFIVDKEMGIIATNRHVAGDLTVSTYTVKFANGTTTDASLLYFDPLYDFAFLKVDPTKLPKDVVQLELSKNPPRVNDSIYSMGNSARDEFSTFKGTVFSVYENLGPFQEQSFRFSGLTIPGASGSPVFTEDGLVVGIVYGGKLVSGAGLPVEYLRDALMAIKEKKLPLRRSLGIVPQYISLEDVQKAELLPEEQAKFYNTSFPESNNKILMINSRMMGSSAQKAFQAGDMLWAVNEKIIGPNLYELDRIVNGAGDKPLSVKVYRAGKLVELKVDSYPLTLDHAQHMVTFADATWVEGNEFVRLFLGFSGQGVFALGAGPTSPLKDLLGDIPAFFAGMRIFQITELDKKPLKTLKDLRDIIPTLTGKREFTLKYIDFQGTVGLGAFASADRQERLAIVKYEGGFDAPKYYHFDKEKKEWEADDIRGATPSKEESKKPL